MPYFESYQIEDGHLHHTLVKVGCSIFDHFYSHNLLSLQILAFYDLTERALAEDIENEVSIPGRTKYDVNARKQGETLFMTRYLTYDSLPHSQGYR